MFLNFKGGTGKTSICAQIAWFLAIQGFNILLVDADPQAHLTLSMGVGEEQEFLTLYDVLVNQRSMKSAIKKVCSGIDIVPSDVSVTKIDLRFSGEEVGDDRLDEAFKRVKSDYDFILVDTNPTISLLNRNIIYSSERLNVVCETQTYSIKGLEDVLGEIEQYCAEIHKEIDYCIIANKYEAKTITSQEAIGYLRAHYREKMLESVIRRSEDFNVAAREGKALFALSNFKSKITPAFEDVKDLVDEIIKKEMRT